MSFLGELAELMPSDVVLYPFVSRDFHDKPSYGPAIALKARIVYQTRRVVSQATGENVISTGMVVLNGLPGATTQDKLVLPGGREAKILDVMVITDELGPVCERLSITA